MNQAATLKQWKAFCSLDETGLNRRDGHYDATLSNPRVLCFSSGKGGVGKTSIVTNLAIAISKMGKNVLVLDADLGLANVDVMLGITPKYSIQHVFSGERSLSDIIMKGPGGIKLLPASSGVQELCHLNESEKLFLLNEFDTLEDSIDVMLIDNAAGISDTVMYFNMASQSRVIILTPEPTSITDAYALIKVLSTRYMVKEFSIIVNWTSSRQEAYKIFKQLTAVADRFLGFLSFNFLGHIPKDTSIPKSVRQQKPALELFPESRACKGFRQLAENIMNQQLKTCDGNIKFFWKNLLRL